ncbi:MULTISPECIES: ATP-binding protein [Streptomyces]|uniref:ATP-binding protein n=1 Tax=Streptomyces chilikensis TaxID=1194079 RepID=A0ABV3EP15_9ACTN|nr:MULTISPECIES: ATP-binding protein [Streptomyces]MDH6225777.1 anti-sigma regulatory factor (Ser/Thr protein kinase) [Streptomyces sp. MJP52]
MATVELLISPLPAHVRTARLVAAAVARRAGVDEAVLDEVRLAVGEACSRAVGLHRGIGLGAPVRIALTDEEKLFSIEVADDAPRSTSVEAVSGDSPAVLDAAESEEDQMGLAVISGLVDDLEVSAGSEGGLIRMTWPTARA